MPEAPSTIRVSAGLLVDGEGRVLLVRKRGTAAFMQPGGKPEPGETPAVCCAREIAEELGLTVTVAGLVPLGEFEAEAANEPGHRVVADAFHLVLTPAQVAAVRPGAEIAEVRWLSVAQARELDLAPLTAIHLLPLV